MTWLAIMDAAPDGSVAKYKEFLTQVEANAHVAVYVDSYPSAFAVEAPSEFFYEWRVDMVAKTIDTSGTRPTPTPESEPMSAEEVWKVIEDKGLVSVDDRPRPKPQGVRA